MNYPQAEKSCCGSTAPLFSAYEIEAKTEEQKKKYRLERRLDTIRRVVGELSMLDLELKDEASARLQEALRELGNSYAALVKAEYPYGNCPF